MNTLNYQKPELIILNSIVFGSACNDPGNAWTGTDCAEGNSNSGAISLCHNGNENVSSIQYPIPMVNKNVCDAAGGLDHVPSYMGCNHGTKHDSTNS